MNKDVIYIDVDDDVTAIIGKIKKAKENIVAIVPPKRTGALQSAVNLRLLERMAKTDGKKLVLITNNQALIALAASTQIPVAKNLQSKPELAEIPAIVVDDGDDIIDGSELPIGDHASTVKVTDGTKAGAAANGLRSEAIDATDITIEGNQFTTAAAATKAVSKKSKNRPKIPNFDTFRKKLILAISGLVGLTALLIWMFVFAPAATVIITASTSPQPVSAAVKLGGTAATNYDQGIVASLMQQQKVEQTVEFEPTGQKDLGTSATGTVSFSTSDADTVLNGTTIPKGTTLRSSSGLAFTTDETVRISTSNYRNARVDITAASGGTNYNGASGSMTGAPSRVSATIVGSTSGGTTNVVRVVSAEDVERANGQLIGKSTDEEKTALIKKFTKDEIIIDSSYTVDRAPAVSTPAVGQQATGDKASLTISTTYTIYAVPKAELNTYLKASMESKINKESQKIYSTGIDNATISNFRKDGETMVATVNTSGSVGPLIDESAIKEQVKGKRYGEVQESLQSIDGIKDVDVQFSYFWVRTVPNNVDKIKIEFKVQDE